MPSPSTVAHGDFTAILLAGIEGQAAAAQASLIVKARAGAPANVVLARWAATTNARIRVAQAIATINEQAAA